MNARELFNFVCNNRRNSLGISDDSLKEYGITTINNPTTKRDEIHNVTYQANDGYVNESIICNDHDRAFEIRPDSNSFTITLYNQNNEIIDEKTFTINDDFLY